MNLLIDFITINIKGGASEYARYFILELARKQSSGEIPNINLYALYDSTKPIAYEDLCEESLSKKCQIRYIDLSQSSLSRVVEEYNIDRFFITCAQLIGVYKDVSQVECEVICVIHDLCDQEMYFNHINEYLDLMHRDHTQEILRDNSFKTKIHNIRMACRMAKRMIKNGNNYECEKKYEYEMTLERMKPIVSLAYHNKKTKIITVSEYTKASIMYNFNIPNETISVLYAPERIYDKTNDKIEDIQLDKLIHTKKKYYLMVSCNRMFKNPIKAIRAFNQYKDNHPDSYLVTIGYPYNTGDNVFNLDFLSDSDLIHAYKNCYALIYPSFFEGFGYPPIEAMHYGKPVLSTNATSVPEILGDAPIYFSPFYESGVYNALKTLSEDNYFIYSRNSETRYKIVKERQNKDTEKLLKILISEK